MKKKEVIIALNHYELPNAAANYGTNLAKSLNRPALLYGVEKVPVIREPLSATGVGISMPILSGIGKVKKEAQQQIAKLHQEAISIYPDIKYDVEIGFSEPSIIEKAEDNDTHLVVVEGDNELSTLHEWFGTYETRLAENIEAPVLVLPKDFYWKPINRIVYIMEVDDSKVQNMRFLTNLVKNLKADIAVVMISNEQNEGEMKKYNQIVRTMHTLLEYKNVNFHQIFTQDTVNTIDKLMNEVGADWLAFEHDSKSFFERMFDGYNTKRLILQSEIPVLVF